MRSEEERVASGEGYIAIETLDEVVVQMVVAPGENVLYGLPFVVRWWEYRSWPGTVRPKSWGISSWCGC